MNKYVDENLNDFSDHLGYCEKIKALHISLYRVNKNISTVHYDITNNKINLDEVSENIQKLTEVYYEFFSVDYSTITPIYAYPYLWDFQVLHKLVSFIAEQRYTDGQSNQEELSYMGKPILLFI